MFDAYGSPPLKPFQPSHSKPAPTATIATLFGASISRSRCESRPDHRRCDEARDAGRQVDHVTAGEVDRAVMGEEAAAPHQERVDRVDERDPQRDRTGSTP